MPLILKINPCVYEYDKNNLAIKQCALKVFGGAARIFVFHSNIFLKESE